MADFSFAEPRKILVSPSPRCPRCTSAHVIATAKRPDADSYWRCNACGEVWSPARREAAAAPSRWPR